MPVRHAVAAILAATFTLPAAPAAGERHRPTPPLIDELNDARRAHGARPLRHSRSLAGSSSRFARRLARAHRFAHGYRIIASKRFSKLGETLALTPGWRVDKMQPLGYWLNSAGHRAVLLDPAFRYAGVARARGRFEGRRVLFWTLQLGR